ncbi:hypothetical protein [Empedobacter brevis]|uniref:hypothetical protein n=1 Tax=Empedobacter brevis TaxID=247 RepID=UPI0028A1726E|nr:hypothetical protein [Empedobacter brevis]
MKLTSSKNFGKTLKDKTDSEYRRLRDNFDNFLEHALHLGMFVPTNEEENVLEEPLKGDYDNYCHLDGGNVVDYESYNEAVYQFKQAKERVLFEGFEIKCSNITNNLQNDFLIISETNEIIGHENKDQWFFNPYKKVEDLINYDLTLTETAIKQIGL